MNRASDSSAYFLLLTAFDDRFRRKLRIEERWMREQFGAAYDQYALCVPALVPYVRWASLHKL